MNDRTDPWWWVVAIGTGIAWCFVVVTSRAHDSSIVAAVGLLLAAPVIGSQMATDIGSKRLPRVISYLGLAITLPWLLASSRVDQLDARGPLLGALAMTAIAATFRVVSADALGLGDVHLAPLLGAIVGWFDPVLVFRVWLVAALIAGACSIVVLVAGGKRSRRIPFGPALVLGVCVAMLGM